MSSLTGKVALVTGGSRGMGAAIARSLAAEGARVALTYVQSEDKARSVVAQIEQAGGEALAIRADNQDPAAVASAVDAAREAFGPLDVLVNNAGIFDAGPFDEFSVADFDRTMNINVRAAFVATQRAAVDMPEEGRVITIGSNLATHVPYPGISLYSLSKAALIGFSRALARELGSRGIRVNVIHPGSTDTDMNPANGELADAQRGTMAIPSYGDPNDVASLVTWLAGPNARSVTGAEVTIDGGTNA
ncbi:3-oxoacyl-ACP reductase family protein [Aquisalimonas lutea]|uniref:SDR family NAD(P)-dependent oxidoreductase n=1 Tax=Aquisalimonas lutea TaxID=1327750 RepID=UPI0025B4813F|nr:3-oxoacyl-ACP reductase family protein [Aquisalimonas lutea]MDN3516581.1 3-oxoacyl-ACP reductase family protein [Aquisalimonas lutea]